MTNATNENSPSSPFLEKLSNKRRPFAYALFGVALLIGALLVLLLSQQRTWDASVVAVFGGLIASILVAAGIALIVSETSKPTMTSLRIGILIVGASCGFLLWFASLVLLLFPPGQGIPNKWWATVTGGIDAWQGEEWWRLWVFLAMLVGGLAIMFVSMLPARTEIYTNPIVRRIIFGYNAVLGTLLVAGNLIILNILTATYLPAQSDWTEKGIFTLSDLSKNILRGLKERDRNLTIYVLLSDRLSFEPVITLLENFQAVNNDIKVRYLFRDRDPEVRELVKKYLLPRDIGILVVLDDNHHFISTDELYVERDQPAQDGRARLAFRGEDALISAIKLLDENKIKPVVYFTQGNGELDITDRFSDRLDRGAFALREALERRNYVVKGLKLGLKVAADDDDDTMVYANEVPADAEVVIIAGPRIPFSKEALEALRRYMQPKDPKAKKGKIVALLDVVADQTGKMQPTGLEPLFTDYRVRPGNERILTLGDRIHQRIKVVATNLRNNPVAKVFERDLFMFFDARPIRPLTERDPLSALTVDLRSETLMVAFAVHQGIFLESNLRAEPALVAQSLLKLNQIELQSRLSNRPVPVAVAVSEPPPFNPNDPHASREPKPRMVVIGDATFVCNRVLEQNPSGAFASLFASCLAWLRERPQEELGIAPKQRDIYVMKENTNLARLIWLPFLLMFISILGLGAGVWVVRRR
ncbi:MAG: hypothetical protein KatS3mg105_3999 [Gemmatales bacterium]|nr:MAG: hypothetical protein KatS3mg105_3999 [Gemmatales bacterium]